MARIKKRRESDASVRRRALQRAETRQALKDAAVASLDKWGFLETAIRDITDAAGVSQATFYLYFEDKSEIYTELIADMDREIAEICLPVIRRARPSTLEESLREIAVLYLDYCRSRKSFARTFLLSPNPALSFDAIRQRQAPAYLDEITAGLRRAIGETALPESDVRDICLGIGALWARIAMSHVISAEGKKSSQERDRVANLLVRLTVGTLGVVLGPTLGMLPDTIVESAGTPARRTKTKARAK